jgi:hypothetical protein
VPLPVGSTGLPRDSVVNVSQLLTLDRGFLTEQVGALPPRLQGSVDGGLRIVLQLQQPVAEVPRLRKDRRNRLSHHEGSAAYKHGGTGIQPNAT